MKPIKNQRGQMTIEAVLTVTLLFFSVVFAFNLIREQRLLAALVEEPWGHLSGMIENGVWIPPEEGQGLHPHHIARHGSPQGDTN